MSILVAKRKPRSLHWDEADSDDVMSTKMVAASQLSLHTARRFRGEKVCFSQTSRLPPNGMANCHQPKLLVHHMLISV